SRRRRGGEPATRADLAGLAGDRGAGRAGLLGVVDPPPRAPMARARPGPGRTALRLGPGRRLRRGPGGGADDRRALARRDRCAWGPGDPRVADRGPGPGPVPRRVDPPSPPAGDACPRRAPAPPR